MTLGMPGTLTDAIGKYTIKGLPLGKYTISSPSSGGWAINDNDYIRQTQDVTISATSPDASSIDFVLVKGGWISGTINDTAWHPLADISVNAGNDTGNAAGTATDASGKYTIKGLPLGKYTISSPSSAGWAINDNDYIRQTQDVTISAKLHPMPAVSTLFWLRVARYPGR